MSEFIKGKYSQPLFDNSRNGIFISTIDGQCIEANPALVDMLGYGNKEQLLSLNIKKDLYVNSSDYPVPGKKRNYLCPGSKKRMAALFGPKLIPG